MKKHITIILALICIFLLTSCGSNNKISLPKPKNIVEIEIVQNNSDKSKKIIERDEISKIIGEIKENTKNTGQESITDQPANIDNYIVVKIHHKNAEGNPSVAYLYKDKGISYIEQPYSGIWKLKEEIFDNISSKLNQ